MEITRKTVHLALIVAICVSPCLSFIQNPFSSWGNIVKNRFESEIKSNGLLLNDVVRRMQIKNVAAVAKKANDNPFSSMLLRGEPTLNMGEKSGGKSLRFANPFNWTSCGPSNQLLDIKSLTIKPSPLSFPGDLTFGFDMVFHDDIRSTDMINADVTIEYSTGSSWLKIPCLGGIGSCKYNNLCQQLKPLQCPSDITKQGVKCNCPFNKGEYKLDSYTVEIDAEVFIAGNYRAKANLTSQTKGNVGCYKIAFSVE